MVNEVKPISFKELSESDEFEKFYRTIWKLTGVPLALVDQSWQQVKLFCPESEMHPVCRVIRASKNGHSRCMQIDEAMCNIAIGNKRGIRYVCHAGLIDFAVPIFVEGIHIATINGGQLFSEPPTEKNFQKLWRQLKDLEIDKQELQEAYYKSPYMDETQLQAVLDLLSFFAEYFCEMGRRLRIVQQNDPHPEITKAKDLIMKNIREEIDFHKIAEQVYLSESYFSRLFKKVEGTTFSRYVQKVRINEAKKLLLQTNCTVTTIAFDVGFSNLSHFNRIFREIEHCTPKEYRNKLFKGPHLETP